MKAVDIGMWYNPHLKLWELWFMDEEGNQVGECEYRCGKKQALKRFNEMQEEMNNPI